MADYPDYADKSARLMVYRTCSGNALQFMAVGNSSVYVGNKDLYGLRDQLNEHLGEAPKPLPVGTIVVGEGLTEAQKERTGELPRWEALSTALHGISWLRTQEGGLFWRALMDRCLNVISSMQAEQKRRETPPRIDVAHFSVKANGEGVNLTYDPYRKEALSPSQARELAAALNKHADAVEASK